MISFTINAALELRVILRVIYFVKHKMPSGVQDMNLQFYIHVQTYVDPNRMGNCKISYM